MWDNFVGFKSPLQKYLPTLPYKGENVDLTFKLELPYYSVICRQMRLLYFRFIPAVYK